MRTLTVIVAAFILHSPPLIALAQNTEATGCKAVPGKACVCGESEACACKTAEQIINPDAALMHGTLLKALLAVVDYRSTAQKRTLQPSEFEPYKFQHRSFEKTWP